MTLEQYLTEMDEHVTWSIRQHRGFKHLTEDDLRSEANIALIGVYEKHHADPAVRSLMRLGTTAVFRHLRGLYEAENAKKRGGHGPDAIRHRGKKRTDEKGFTQVDFEQYAAEARHEPEQLDRLLIREAVDRVVVSASRIERRTLRKALRPSALDSETALRALRDKTQQAVEVALTR